MGVVYVVVDDELVEDLVLHMFIRRVCLLVSCVVDLGMGRWMDEWSQLIGWSCLFGGSVGVGVFFLKSNYSILVLITPPTLPASIPAPVPPQPSFLVRLPFNVASCMYVHTHKSPPPPPPYTHTRVEKNSYGRRSSGGGSAGFHHRPHPRHLRRADVAQGGRPPRPKGLLRTPQRW